MCFGNPVLVLARKTVVVCKHAFPNRKTYANVASFDSPASMAPLGLGSYVFSGSVAGWRDGGGHGLSIG